MKGKKNGWESLYIFFRSIHIDYLLGIAGDTVRLHFQQKSPKCRFLIGTIFDVFMDMVLEFFLSFFPPGALSNVQLFVCLVGLSDLGLAAHAASSLSI